jgi:hypothetical protein
VPLANVRRLIERKVEESEIPRPSGSNRKRRRVIVREIGAPTFEIPPGGGQAIGPSVTAGQLGLALILMAAAALLIYILINIPINPSSPTNGIHRSDSAFKNPDAVERAELRAEDRARQKRQSDWEHQKAESDRARR